MLCFKFSEKNLKKLWGICNTEVQSPFERVWCRKCQFRILSWTWTNKKIFYGKSVRFWISRYIWGWWRFKTYNTCCSNQSSTTNQPWVWKMVCFYCFRWPSKSNKFADHTSIFLFSFCNFYFHQTFKYKHCIYLLTGKNFVKNLRKKINNNNF